MEVHPSDHNLYDPCIHHMQIKKRQLKNLDSPRSNRRKLYRHVRDLKSHLNDNINKQQHQTKANNSDTLKKSEVTLPQPSTLDSFDSYEVPGWEKNVSRDSNRYVRYNELTSHVTPKFRGPHMKSKFHILIAIPSAPGHKSRRDIIRKYSGKDCTDLGLCEYVFILGIPKGSNATETALLQSEIAAEAKEHQDVLQEDFLDDYFNLTLKSVFTLKYFVSLPDKYTHLLKVDDDCFFNVPAIIAICNTLEREHGSNWITGMLWNDVIPHRDLELVGTKKGRWLMPNYMFSGKVYPSYFGGPGYMMTRLAAKYSLENSKSNPLIFLEDVYVTGTCLANECKNGTIKRVASSAFLTEHSYENTDFEFDPSSHAIIHKVTGEQYHGWYLLVLLHRMKSSDAKTRKQLIQRLEELIRKSPYP